MPTQTIEIYQNDQLIDTQTIDNGLTNIQNEYLLYIKRKTDGERMFLELASELRLAKVAGVINETVFNSIEDQLIPVRNEVIFGQWKTGLRKLEALNPAYIGQDLYNRIYGMISDYIIGNY